MFRTLEASCQRLPALLASGMGVLTSPKTYTGLAAFQAVDAIACAAQVPPIKKSLDEIGCPDSVRRVGDKAANVAPAAAFLALFAAMTAKGPSPKP